MEPNEKNLTPTEWHLMECLWEHAPRTGREAAEFMARSQGWSRSTTLTLLRRKTAQSVADAIDVSLGHVYRLQKKGVRRIRGMLSRFIHDFNKI